MKKTKSGANAAAVMPLFGALVFVLALCGAPTAAVSQSAGDYGQIEDIKPDFSAGPSEDMTFEPVEDITPQISPDKLMKAKDVHSEKPDKTERKETVTKTVTTTVEEPEDINPAAGPPPGADKLKRSDKKPVAIEKTAEDEKTQVAKTTVESKDAVTTATAATKVAATSTTTVAAAATDTTSTQAATPTTQLPPGAVVVATQGGAEKKPRDIVPYGTVEIASRSTSASGNEAAFLSQNGLLFYNNKFTQNIRLGFKGALDNGVAVRGEFQDMPYMDSVYHLAASGRHGFADFGDTQANFQSGAMTAFSKSIRGVSAGYSFGQTDFRVLMSSVKSKTQDEAFNGRNIRGPYSLSSNDIMENSEVVRLNGKPLPRSEYVVDYFLGQITFRRTLDPGDRVEVTYESRLWVASRTGDLRGVSVATKALRGRAGLGVSYLVEEADSSSSAKVVSGSKKLSYNDINAAGGIIKLVETGHVEKNREVVSAASDTLSTYLSSPSDYTLDYASGVIYFATGTSKFMGYSTTTVFTVSYTYFRQTDLHWIQAEELSGSGMMEYPLQYDSVYGGTELADLFENGALIRRLVAGTDYEVNEANNSIVFLSSSVMPDDVSARTVRISYEVVPANSRVAEYKNVKRDVKSLYGNITLGRTTFTAEAAESGSEVRLKEVAVVEEAVGTVMSSTVLTYTLDHDAITETIEVYFNDPAAPSSLMHSGTDYVAERDAITEKTKLTFKNKIPLGTTIIANYRYRAEPPVGEESDRKGQAARVTASGSAGAVAYSGEFMRKSPFFAPLTAYNDLESSRFIGSLDIWRDRKLSLRFDAANNSYYTGLFTGDKNMLDHYTARVGYKPRKNVDAAYTMEKRKRSDNLATSLVDNSLTGHKFEMGYRAAQFNSGFTFELRSYDDGTGNAADRDTVRYGGTFDYAPKPTVKLNLALDNSKMDSSPQGGAAAEFTLNNFSTRMGVTYLPNPDLSINAGFDKQRLTDSRDESAVENLDNITANIFGRTKSRLRDYTLSYYLADRPDRIYGDSRTEITSARGTVRAAQNVAVIPSYVITRAAIGEGTSSGDNTQAIRLEYRGGAKLGWRGALSYSSSDRDSRSISSTTPGAVTLANSSQKQTSLNIDYVPDARMNASFVWQDTATESNGAAAQSRHSYSTVLNYFLNEITSLRLLFNIEAPPAPAGALTTIEFNGKRKIDRNFDFGLDYKMQNQKGEGASGYRGRMMTMKLLASF